MHKMLHKHSISFKHAFDGIKWAFSTQPNYRIHLTLSIFSIVAGYILHISYLEWIAIMTMIFIGLAMETVNTSIEKVCDAISESFNEHIKIAKDVAAGAMLLFAGGAVIVASIIFIPKFISLISGN